MPIKEKNSGLKSNFQPIWRHLSLTSTPIDYLKGRKCLEFRQVDCLKGP